MTSVASRPPPKSIAIMLASIALSLEAQAEVLARRAKLGRRREGGDAARLHGIAVRPRSTQLCGVRDVSPRLRPTRGASTSSTLYPFDPFRAGFSRASRSRVQDDPSVTRRGRKRLPPRVTDDRSSSPSTRLGQVLAAAGRRLWPRAPRRPCARTWRGASRCGPRSTGSRGTRRLLVNLFVCRRAHVRLLRPEGSKPMDQRGACRKMLCAPQAAAAMASISSR